MADPKSGNNGPKNIRIFRKDLMKSVDRDELEVLDQSVEFVALILGLVMVILQFVVVPYSPVLGSLLNSFNILTTLFVWASYRIAVIKQAIDLRLWVLVNAAKLFCAFIVMTAILMFAPLVPSEYYVLYTWATLVVPLVVFLAGTYASDYAEKRWFQLIGYAPAHPEGKEPPPRNALYIVDKVRMDWSVYVFSYFVIIVLASGVSEFWRLAVAGILLFPVILVVLSSFADLRRAQKEILAGASIQTNPGS